MVATLILRTVAAGGLKPEFEHARIRRRRAVMSPADASSPRSREINERGINVYRFVWKTALPGIRTLVKKLWADAKGSTLPMRFTPALKTDAAMEDVYFVPGSLRISRSGPLTSAIEFEVEGRR